MRPKNMFPDLSCVHRAVTEEQLAEVVARVDKAEAEGRITPWEEADVPSSLLEEEPEPGSIVSEKEVPVLGGTELVLSNGMKVSFVHESRCSCSAVHTDAPCWTHWFSTEAL